MAEICTVSLHSSYTAENLHIIRNETNGMRKFYHPLRMTAVVLVMSFWDRVLEAHDVVAAVYVEDFAGYGAG